MPQMLSELLDTHRLGQLLEQNLDEDTRARSGVFLGENDTRKDLPSNGIRCEDVGKELCNVSELVGFISVNCIVICSECLLVEFLP